MSEEGFKRLHPVAGVETIMRVDERGAKCQSRDCGYKISNRRDHGVLVPTLNDQNLKYVSRCHDKLKQHRPPFFASAQWRMQLSRLSLI